MSNMSQHIDKIANDAGLGVMDTEGILGILHDRESVGDERLLALTANDVNDLYDRFIGPAIDSIEDYLLSSDE